MRLAVVGVFALGAQHLSGGAVAVVVALILVVGVVFVAVVVVIGL